MCYFVAGRMNQRMPNSQLCQTQNENEASNRNYSLFVTYIFICFNGVFQSKLFETLNQQMVILSLADEAK